MNEADDRLAGDPVWELFPYSTHEPAPRTIFSKENGRWLLVAILIVASWCVFPSLAIVTTCWAVADRDIRKGRRLARSIPDPAGGAVCARFSYAWGVWKLGMTAMVMLFLTPSPFNITARPGGDPPGLLTALFLCIGGFTGSAVLTASGMLTAYRSGMKVWIGEGVNQTRTLLLAMLIVGFVFGVLVPSCVWLSVRFSSARDARAEDLSPLVGFFGCMFGGPVAILLLLDRLSDRVVADRPAKFGPKVPAVGKWEHQDG